MSGARWVLVLVVGVLLACAARGQLAGDAGTDLASHGWVVVRVPGESSATLAHLPPRAPTQVAAPSPEGRMRAVASLTEMPTEVAADGASVYMLFGAEPSGERRLAMLSVRASGVRDLWVREPESRLLFVESLPAADAVYGLAAEGGRLVALVRQDGVLSLLVRAGSGWETQEGPGVEPGAEVVLYSSEAGLHVVERGAGGWRLHTRAGGDWKSARVVVPEEEGGLSVLGVWRGEVIALGARGGRGAVWSLGVGEPLLLGGIDPPGAEFASAVLHSSGRVVIAWTQPGEVTQETGSALPKSEVPNPVRRLVEFGLVEGRTVYAGAANTTAPVSAGEFRTLAFGLMLLMAVVLVVVLRPAPESGVIVLPVGLAIAGPGRRLVASAIDGLAGILIVGRALDLGVLEVLGPLALPATGMLDVGPLAMAIGVNILHCTVSETLFGRTLGKAATGLIVARVDPALGALPAGQFKPPGIGRSLARNVIKWVLPPVAMLALSDPSGRHRGDLIARSAVLCRAGEPLSDG